MPVPRLLLACSLSLLVAPVACQGKASAPTPTREVKAASANAPTETKTAPLSAAPAAPDARADGGPSPSEIAAAEASQAKPDAAATQGPVASLQGDPGKALGGHLVDPRWFRKTMFGDGAKVLDTKRSQADDQGRFSSLIRFEISDKTPEACADHLQALVKDDVPEVERKTTPEGRVQLSGSTDRYKITFVCGENEGKTIAFVSYQWT
jgi:hypothetical protein